MTYAMGRAISARLRRRSMCLIITVMERIRLIRGCPIHRATAVLSAMVAGMAILALITFFMAGGCDKAHSGQSHGHSHADDGHTHADDGHTHEHDGHAHSHAPSDLIAHEKSGPLDDDPAYRDVPAPLAIADHALLHPVSDPSAACTCEVNRYHNGWCKRCNLGHVAGRSVKSARLFEALDAHGHDLNPETFHVPLCSEAAQNDAWCPEIAMGFVASKLYFTRLTWGLAKGRPVIVERLSCAVCRASGGDQPAWCDACSRGIVGNMAYFDRALFDRTAAEFSTLLAALAKAPTCDYCAAAMLAYQVCPVCRISYQSPGVPKAVDTPTAEATKIGAGSR